MLRGAACFDWVRCRSKCGSIAHALTKLGYRNVFVYAEGKADWIEAGLPVERGAGALAKTA